MKRLTFQFYLGLGRSTVKYQGRNGYTLFIVAIKQLPALPKAMRTEGAERKYQEWVRKFQRKVATKIILAAKLKISNRKKLLSIFDI